MKKTTTLALSALAAIAAPIAVTAMEGHKGHSHAEMAEKALKTTFTNEIFADAQTAGKHIVIDVWKKGCPTCRVQSPSLEEARTLYPDAVFLKVDFENQKDVVAGFNVSKQSTIIVFDGTMETGRVLGETNRDKLIALIATGAA